MKSIFLLVLLLMVLLGSPWVNAGEDVWLSFLNTPNQVSHDQLAEAIARCNESGCKRVLAPSSAEVERLLDMVRRRDLQAVDIAFLSVRFLDGGALEDTYRELGTLTETDPKLFLVNLKGHKMTPHQTRRLLRMLPLNTVDDMEKKRRTVKHRIRSLSSVDDPSLLEVRDKSVNILNELLGQL